MNKIVDIKICAEDVEIRRRKKISENKWWFSSYLIEPYLILIGRTTSQLTTIIDIDKLIFT